MKQNEHRFGVTEANLLVRKLKLKRGEASPIERAVRDIDKLFGVDCVFFDEESSVLTLAYDASRVCIDCIEDVLISHGVDLRDDWWTRFRKSHYRLVDQNVKGKRDSGTMALPLRRNVMSEAKTIYIDPVCSMTVTDSVYCCKYEGDVYYFCCESCLEKFKQDPRDYLGD